MLGGATGDTGDTRDTGDTGDTGEAAELALPDPPPAPTPVDESENPPRNVFGTRVLAALQAAEPDELLKLTPLENPDFQALCPRLVTETQRKEIESRHAHCRKLIDWSRLEQVGINEGVRSGEPHPACGDGSELMGRIRLAVRLDDDSTYLVDIFGAVLEGEEVRGFSGKIECKPLPR